MSSSFKYRRLNKDDIEGLGALFSNHLPAYRNLITSYSAKR